VVSVVVAVGEVAVGEVALDEVVVEGEGVIAGERRGVMKTHLMLKQRKNLARTSILKMDHQPNKSKPNKRILGRADKH
jgi:hypothetical protein